MDGHSKGGKAFADKKSRRRPNGIVWLKFVWICETSGDAWNVSGKAWARVQSFLESLASGVP